MARTDGTNRSTARLAIALIGTAALAGCGLRPQPSEMAAPQSAPAPAEQTAQMGEIASADVAQAPNNVPALQPQLVRTAHLGVTVDSIADAIAQARAIARQQQGEVMNLQDRTPAAGEHHTATMQIRVPQANLDATIAALSDLGTVQQQTLTAEDVSEQLVDYQARLRNLRKAEETVLAIMNRSGNVGDVLKVAQELNNIRQTIEQINAQLSSLQNRVTDSTIDLSLRSAIAPVSAQPPMQTQLTNTWNDATQSIAKLTVDLMQLGLWLMVYSPYLLLMAGAAVLVYRRRRRVRSVREG